MQIRNFVVYYSQDERKENLNKPERKQRKWKRLL